MEWIAFAKPQLYQEGPLQKNSPECLKSIINLHSEPGRDFLDMWFPDHTALIHADQVEKGMAGKYLQSPKRPQLWTKYSNCLLLVCWLWNRKVLDQLHWIYILKSSKGSLARKIVICWNHRLTEWKIVKENEQFVSEVQFECYSGKLWEMTWNWRYKGEKHRFPYKNVDASVKEAPRRMLSFSFVRSFLLVCPSFFLFVFSFYPYLKAKGILLLDFNREYSWTQSIWKLQRLPSSLKSWSHK